MQLKCNITCTAMLSLTWVIVQKVKVSHNCGTQHIASECPVHRCKGDLVVVGHCSSQLAARPAVWRIRTILQSNARRRGFEKLKNPK